MEAGFVEWFGTLALTRKCKIEDRSSKGVK